MEGKIQIIRGTAFPKGFLPEAITSAIDYKPKSGDIFVMSYPKCGTTWLQKIVLLILRRGKLSTAVEDMFFQCPFLEMSGIESVYAEPKPLALKTHLPYHLAPISEDAKYIYICRHPMDCLVSYYYHINEFTFSEFTFNEFVELYLSTDISFGDYLDHLVGWYEHKDDPNMHFLTYEDLKKDTRGEILKIAKFIGEEFWKLLVEEPNVLDDIIRYSSFDFMKEETNEVLKGFWRGELDVGGRELPPGLKSRLEFNKKSTEQKKRLKSGEFLRKGIVGDWKNHFSAEEKRRIDEWIAEKTAKYDVMALWE